MRSISLKSKIMKRFNLSFVPLILAVAFYSSSCTGGTEGVERRQDRRTDRYQDRQDRREIRADARQERTDAWYERHMN